ncbi:hypothetical protein BDP27DRAFT_1394009 [Rhodocollybia butyracea]|uniref:SWIM-type domain-containing protein n=1 Tax=Rhodocollybia butyracea TaxID=206335 RepID=A0A9P5PH03_9AGAR|nr:hypothetical protein BDP27DRAFT_1394009 [Rhodocollybia butyracea]
MSSDQLAEFNGIQPIVMLKEGEEKVVQSKTSDVKFIVKRTKDYFYCMCPAWRNQSGVPVNARSCKHLLSLLGQPYEEARLEYMNPGGPLPKGLPVRKARASKTIKQIDETDDKMDVDGDGSQRLPIVKTPTPTTTPKGAGVDANDAGHSRKPSSKSKAPLDSAQAARAKRKRADESSEEDTAKNPTPPKGKSPAKRPVEDDSVTEDDSEEERPKKKSQKPPSSKTKKPVNRKATPEDDEDEDVDVEEEKPTKKSTKPASSSKAKSSKKHKAISEDDIDEEEEPKKSKKPVSSKGKPASKRPTKRARQDDSETEDSEEEKTKKPPTSSKGKASTKKPVKRKATEADEDEEDEKPMKKPTKPASSSKAKPPKKRKAVSETEDDADEEEEPKKPKKPVSSKGKPASKRLTKRARQDDSEHEDTDEEKTKKPSSSRKPVSKAREIEDDDEDEDEGSDNDEDEGDDDEGLDGDELASIKGIKPNVLLKDGEEKEVQSQTSSSVYKVKRTFDHYYCTCPAWRNQGGIPVNARSCKHLVALLGEKYEAARVKRKNPDGPTLNAPKKKTSSKSKKGKDGDGGKADFSVLLANSWDVDTGPDPTGWWISEKLDGVRTYYDGKLMYSRLGNPFTPPQWFLDKLPKNVTLDGELFGGRQKFQETVSIVKTMNSPHWKDITFHVFDIPSIGTQPFETRMEQLKKFFEPGTGSHASDKVTIVEHEKAKNRKHVIDKLKEPGSQYEARRSSTLLKLKSFYDAEAIVTGYKDGKGRNAGVTGALKCKMASGKTFDVGSGLNDKQRKSPPKIGSIIVYRFQELTKDGVPRFPTYLGEAADKAKPKDAIVPDHRKGATTKSDD